MHATRLHARFPSDSFISQAEFAEYCRTAQPALDTRYLHETSLAPQDDTLVQPGTCAPCLRRTVFSSVTRLWERLADGRRVPEWSGALHCDCEDRLPNHARALVHFCQSVAGLRGWTRLLMLGPLGPAAARLRHLAGEATVLPRLIATDAGARLDAPDKAFQLAVATDYLQRVPPLPAAFAELRRVLAPGGSLVFTVPFRYRAARTTSRANLPPSDGRPATEFREPVHEIGWDVLDQLRAAGFRHAVAHSFWSNELGYLGSFNMILHAAL
jgi:SAM-dependent methyltransferase